MTTWIVRRSAGIGAYLLLFLSVAWGLIGTTALFGKKVSKATAVTVHQYLATAALLLLGVHLGGLLIDSFMPFRLFDILLPLHTTFQPVPVALGVLAMYAMVVVLTSSWTRKHVAPVLWRRLHMLAAPAFGLAMLHGIFAGTDTAPPLDVVGLHGDRTDRGFPGRRARAHGGLPAGTPPVAGRCPIPSRARRGRPRA